MIKCTKCLIEFNWKEIFKSIILGYKPLVCKNCGLQYNVKFIFRIINSSLIAIPIMIIPLFHLQSKYNIYEYIIYVVLIGLLMPFWTKYKIDNLSQ